MAWKEKLTSKFSTQLHFIETFHDRGDPVGRSLHYGITKQTSLVPAMDHDRFAVSFFHSSHRLDELYEMICTFGDTVIWPRCEIKMEHLSGYRTLEGQRESRKNW